MSVKRVTSQSFTSRLGNSVSGVLGGIALCILAVALLFWNEGRAVDTARGLAEGETSVVSLDVIDHIDIDTNGNLVHLTGRAESGEVLHDDAFGMEVPALKLRRSVEMLQWRENSESKTRTKIGGGTETETSYTYEKIWSDSIIDSSQFEEEGHENPGAKPLESREVDAAEIRVGAYRLGPGLVARINRFEELPPPGDLPEGHVAQGNVIFRSADPNAPQVGDLRIILKAAMPAEVSVVARNNDGRLEGFKTSTGSTIQLLQYGEACAVEMFQAAKSANKTLTFGLRILGMLLLFVGVKSVLGPIAVVADVLPLVGRVTRAGTTLLSGIVALPVAFATISIAWLAYRPLIGIGLILLGGAVVAGLVWYARKRAASAARA